MKVTPPYRAADRSAEHPDAPLAIQRTIHFMRSNLDRPLRINEIARRAGLASSQFYSVFRSATGQSPKQMLTQIRLERASELLLMTNLTLEEVGGQAGMPCVRSFRRTFSALHGITPARLRQVRDRFLAQ